MIGTFAFTRLRQDAPCGSTGRNGDRRPRRSPQGEDGWLRRSSAWLRHRCPARERGELPCADILDSGAAILEFVKDLAFEKFCNDRKTYSAVIREFEKRASLGVHAH
jgi:hypothetical protein